MKQINDYFNKFKNIIPKETIIKDRALWIIESTIGIHLDRKELKIENDVLWIRSKAAIKHEIKRHEKEIISYINANPYNHTIYSIQ